MSEQTVPNAQEPVADQTGPATEPASYGSPFLDEIVKKITNSIPDGVARAYEGIDMPTLVVSLDHYVGVARALRDMDGVKFTLLSDLTAVDYLEREPRFDVVVHLYSFERNAYIRLKTMVPIDPAVCPTLTDVYAGANWLEREVWDMFGITFPGHPNLTRLVTPDGWEYFALRRDFPLQGPGMIKLYDKVTDVF